MSIDYEDNNSFNNENEEFFYNEDDNYNDQQIIQQNKKFPYLYISEKEILNERENLIQISQEKLFLTRDQSILALVYFKWNIFNLIDLWYDNPEKYSEEMGIIQSSKSIQSLNNQNIFPNNTECSICLTDKDSLSENEFFSLSCLHYFCIYCWKEYIKVKNSEIFTAIASSCPQKGCNCIVTETIVYKILENLPNEIENYNKIIIKNFTDYNSIIKSCPYPNCNTYYSSDKMIEFDIFCIKCKDGFCFKCLKPSHQPIKCNYLSDWDSKVAKDNQTFDWIKLNTKQCPKCNRNIEKNQGCNVMTCQKTAGGCGNVFCWICLKSYKQYTTCHTTEIKDDNTDIEKKKIKLQEFVDLYFFKYLTYKKSMEHAITLYDKINKYRSDLYLIKDIPFSETEYMIDSLDFLVKARSILSNSYILLYYLNSDSSQFKLFSYQVLMLENKSELLHQLLVIETYDNVIKIDNFNQFYLDFNKLKNEVVDLSSTLKNFSQNLLNITEDLHYHFENKN